MATTATSPYDRFSSVTHIGFNQDVSCLTVGTLQGFSIFNVSPFRCLFTEQCGAVSIVEMLFRTSLLAVVGSGDDAQSSSRILSLFNTKQRQFLARLVFQSAVQACKLNLRRLVVQLSKEIRIYDLKTLAFLHKISSESSSVNSGSACLSGRGTAGFVPSCPNPSTIGTCAVSGTPHGGFLAIPSSSQTGMLTLVDTYSLKCSGTVAAHRSVINAMSFNVAGTLLATCSKKGTIIRVWSVPELERLWVFRRGSTLCSIRWLSFSPNSDFLISTGTRSTVHIFKLGLTETQRDVHAAAPIEETVAAFKEYIWGRERFQAEKGRQTEEKGRSAVGLYNVTLPAAYSGEVTTASNAQQQGRGTMQHTYVHDSSASSISASIGTATSTFGPSVSDVASLATTAVNSLASYLPEPYRHAVEASRCFAKIHLQGTDSTCVQCRYEAGIHRRGSAWHLAVGV